MKRYDLNIKFSDLKEEDFVELMQYPDWGKEDLKKQEYWSMGYNVFQGNPSNNLARCLPISFSDYHDSFLLAQELNMRRNLL